MMESRRVDVAEAVQHLSDYYRHLTTISAGAIVVIGAFTRDIGSNGEPGALAGLAVGALGICVVMSTLMMWAYGAARREVANADGGGSWAYDVPSISLAIARVVVVIGSFVAPLSFIAGFAMLAYYAAGVLT